jgi:hypothetical protein
VRSALHCVCLDTQAPDMGAEIGARSALAAKAWADCYTDSAKRAEIYAQIVSMLRIVTEGQLQN